MTLNDYLKLQIGMFITDNEDTTSPQNYCLIKEFHDGRIRLQPYDYRGEPEHAHDFWEPYTNINLKAKLYASEYRALCNR